MDSNYVPVLEVAKAANCSITTIHSYIEVSEKSVTHLPFPDVITLYDGFSGHPTKAIRTEDALVFIEWYKEYGGKRGSKKALAYIKPVEDVKQKDDRVKLLLRIDRMRKDITRIGTEMMGLLHDLEEIENGL